MTKNRRETIRRIYTDRKFGLTTAILFATFVVAAPAAASVDNVTSKIDENGAFLQFETVELPCLYKPAQAGGNAGYVKIINLSAGRLNGGLPVNYRLSSTGEEFTFHLQQAAEQSQSVKAAHQHIYETTCTAWTFIR